MTGKTVQDDYTICSACEGKGKNQDGSVCFECNGSGKRQNACVVPAGPEQDGVCD